MRIFDIFRKSPFDPLQDMMKKVLECVKELYPFFDAVYSGDSERIKKQAEKISHLEFETDQMKNRIRSSLPKSIFMPVSRGDILEIISTEDAIADAAEDIAILFTLKDNLSIYPELKELLKELVDRAIKVVEEAGKVIDELDVLAETSFEGPEAQRIIGIIDDVCDLEHHTDEYEKKVTKSLLANEDKLSPAELWLWLKIVAKIGDLANYAERMVNKVRLFLSK